MELRHLHNSYAYLFGVPKVPFSPNKDSLLYWGSPRQAIGRKSEEKTQLICFLVSGDHVDYCLMLNIVTSIFFFKYFIF